MTKSFFPIETKHFFIQPLDKEKLCEEKWVVKFKDSEESGVGSVSFAGPAVHGEVEIHAELDSSFEKSGYYEEIFFSMSSLIFKLFDAKEIHTVCRHENEKCVRGLEKAGYVLRERKDGSDYYSIKKHKTVWTGAYLFIGLIAGFMMGILFSNLWLGTGAGVVIGAVLGYLMDQGENKKS